MTSRYDARIVFKNRNNLYYNLLEERGLNHIVQYNSPRFKKLTPAQYRSIVRTEYIWTMGDRFYKLAAEHYGDPKLWWVIARFNMRPTESHFKGGDVIYIPFPVDRLLDYYGV